MRLVPIAMALLSTTPALAAEEPTPRIIVTGTASVSTPPDRAIIQFSLHGEGATSDDAVRAMVDKRKMLDQGIASLAKAGARSISVNVQEVRGPGCMRQSYPAQPRLSTGECAIVGYTADQMMEVRTAAVKDAGTIVGLIGRLGGTNPRVDRFLLSDDGPARALAVAAALAEARSQAEAIAAGSKVMLGRILSISDGNYMMPMGDIVVTAESASAPMAPPPPPPPPIIVSANPRAIETQARVQVIFAIGQ